MVRKACSRGVSTGYKITVIVEGPDKTFVEHAVNFMEKMMNVEVRNFPQPEKELQKNTPCGCSGS